MALLVDSVLGIPISFIVAVISIREILPLVLRVKRSPTSILDATSMRTVCADGLETPNTTHALSCTIAVHTIRK